MPLTTYTFSTNVVDTSNTVSASDENRLPPGAFSLRYGFPHWFASAGQVTDPFVEGKQDEEGHIAPSSAAEFQPTSQGAGEEAPEAKDRSSIILNVLRHVQAAFEDENLLDNMPLDASGDPSAWHAWRAHRGLSKPERTSKVADGEDHDAPAPVSPKHPGEWKWDGVFESRVRNAIEASVSEVTLFGSTGAGRAGPTGPDLAGLDPRQRMLAMADRQIRFSKLNYERFEELRSQILSSASPVST